MTAAQTKQFLDLEKAYWRAIQDRDADAALKLTAEPCMMAGASGVATVDKSAFAGIMDSGNYTLHDFEFKDFQVQQVASDVAVVGYNVVEKLTVEGKPVTLNAADTSVWVREKGDWRCALHTESVLGDAFGRDRK